jgi:hypothetical protein
MTIILNTSLRENMHVAFYILFIYELIMSVRFVAKIITSV